MNTRTTALCITALFGVALGAGVPAASAQAAPGASAEMSLMSTDLQAARASAISMKSQGDQFRQQKLLALQAQAGAVGSSLPMDLTGMTATIPTIPNGSGLVSGQARHTVIGDFLADTAGIVERPEHGADNAIADPG